MLNKVLLMGRLCAAPELKTTPNNVSVVAFRIAVQRNRKSKNQESVTDFFNVVAWRNTAEFICRYFDKGSLILVEGELQTRSYVNPKTNQTEYITEVIAASVDFTGERKTTSMPTSSEQQTNYSTPNTAENVTQQEMDNDDDYPF